MKKTVICVHLVFAIAFFTKVTLWDKPKPTKVNLHFTSKQAQPSLLPTQKRQVQHKAIEKPPLPKQLNKKTQTPEKPKPKPAPQKKPSSAKETLTVKKQSAKEKTAKETIAKIEEKLDKLEQLTKTEIKQDAGNYTSFDNPQLETEENNISLAVQYLFELLELPGPGKVTVEMLFTNDGRIEKVEILDSENEDNSSYLKDKLINLVLPFEKKNQIPASLKVCFSNLKY